MESPGIFEFFKIKHQEALSKASTKSSAKQKENASSIVKKTVRGGLRTMSSFPINSEKPSLQTHFKAEPEPVREEQPEVRKEEEEVAGLEEILLRWREE